MQYRRIRIKGASYFFTLNLLERNKSLLIDNIEILRQAFKHVQMRHPFKIEAIVILPEHLHTIWTLPENDQDYSTRWMLIKASFSRCIAKTEQRNKSRFKKGERGIWQRRYWEHLIRNDNDFEQHVNYIHFNPVKHGYVERVAQWEYSSFHQWVRKGILSNDWGSEAIEFENNKYGE